MNIGHEDNELKPFHEPTREVDPKRIEIMVNMGYSRKEIEDSLAQNKYDDITATYLLLGRRTNELENSDSRSGSSLSLKQMQIPHRPTSENHANNSAQSPQHPSSKQQQVPRSSSAQNSSSKARRYST